MTATIALEKMKFHAFHGVSDDERRIGATFIVDLSYTLDTNAVETDNLADAVDYADIFNAVKQEMEQPSRLIEHVAGRIARAVGSRFPQIASLSVSVAKCRPPVNGEVERACVTINCLNQNL